MQIIKADKSNLQDLAKLFDDYRVFYKQQSDIEGATKFLAERFDNDESVIFAAEEDRVLLGFTQLYPFFTSVGMKRSWVLNDLYVAAEQRGRGISKKLIEAAKEFTKHTQANGLSLETEKSNTIGNNLYPKVGFDLDEGHNYYYWKNSN